MKYIKIALPLIIVILICMLFKQYLLDLARDLATYNNQEKGIVDKDSIRWCSFPLSHDLDKGGVPFDIQDVTHPSIVYIPNCFNGYNCWMSTTPYPCSLPTSGEPYENTCIYFANTNDNKSFPSDFFPINQNPIILKSGAKYNSDPDLLFDEESNCLYSITRKRRAKGYITNIVYQKSIDGQKWSQPISLFTTETNSLCPCILKINGKYLIYTFEVNSDGRRSTKEIDVWESESLENPSFRLVNKIKWNLPSNFWHGDVFFYNGKYYMVYCGTRNDYKTILGSSDLAKYMWLAVSNDGLHFEANERPLLKMNGVYRSSLVITNDIMSIYFSVSNRYRKDKKQYPYGNRIGLVEIPLKNISK